jgi:hypothetical protein
VTLAGVTLIVMVPPHVFMIASPDAPTDSYQRYVWQVGLAAADRP